MKVIPFFLTLLMFTQTIYSVQSKEKGDLSLISIVDLRDAKWTPPDDHDVSAIMRYRLYNKFSKTTSTETGCHEIGMCFKDKT